MTRYDLIQTALSDFVRREPHIAAWCLYSAAQPAQTPWKLAIEVKQSTGLPEEAEGPHWMVVTTERIEPINGDTRVAVILTSVAGGRRDRQWWYNLDLTEKRPAVPSVHYYDDDADDFIRGLGVDEDAQAERRQMGITS